MTITITQYKLTRHWSRTYVYETSRGTMYHRVEWIHPGAYKKIYQWKFRNERKLLQYLREQLPESYDYTFCTGLEKATAEYVFLVSTEKKRYSLKERPKKYYKKYRKYKKYYCPCALCNADNKKKNFIAKYMEE